MTPAAGGLLLAARAVTGAAHAARGPTPLRAAVLRCPAAKGPGRGHWARAAAAAGDGGAAQQAEPSGRSVTSATPERAEKQSMIDLQPPRGTRDFPPEDMRLRKWLFGKFAEARACY